MSQTLIPLHEIDTYLDPRLWTICTAAILNGSKHVGEYEDAIQHINQWIGDINTLNTVIEYHGLSGVMHTLSKHPQLDLPASSSMIIKASTAKHAQRWQAITQVLGSINTIANNIDFCLLKGSALASDIYNSPYERAMSDIDIMCSPENALTLYKKCVDNGFSVTEVMPSELTQHHHLPAIYKKIGQHSIYVEIHTHGLSHDLKDQIEWQDIHNHFRKIDIAGITLNTLQHETMLLQLCAHAFARDQVIKLSNIVDIFRYSLVHEHDINWSSLASQQPQVILIMRYTRLLLQLPSDILAQTPALEPKEAHNIRGLGEGMMPLRECWNTHIPITKRLHLLFFPSPWWQRIFYRVEPRSDKKMIRVKTAHTVRYIIHPLNILYWSFSKVIFPNVLKKALKLNLPQLNK